MITEPTSSELTVTLKNSGLIVTIELGMDYPQPYSSVSIVKLDAPVALPQETAIIKSELNELTGLSLTQMIEKIEQHCA